MRRASKVSHPSDSPCPRYDILSSRFEREIAELLPPKNKRFEDDLTMIRTHSDHESARRFGDLTRRILETHFGWKNETFRAPAISQNFTKCCACHEKSQSTSQQILPLHET